MRCRSDSRRVQQIASAQTPRWIFLDASVVYVFYVREFVRPEILDEGL